ncbi:hypothetical protein [Bradyrhizobium sp. 2TAF24]|uniref:hypothetical protein n=1 Tax=Bradyrhizobium sp. 2TAF24 TaxID=3233011 RepID=UPI003F8F4A8D
MTWQDVINRLQRVEAPFKALGQLSGVAILLSVLGWLVSALIQYNSWTVEHRLKAAETDLEQVTKTFTETSDLLSRAITLQQMLVFNYVAALEADTDLDSRLGFLGAQAKAAYDDYTRARIELRQSIDVIARRAEIYIDWPSWPTTTSPVDKVLQDPLTLSTIGAANIDCDTLIAPGQNVARWTMAPLSSQPGAPQVDWRSAKHHLAVIYTCFDHLHRDIEPIRRWTAAVKADAPPPTFDDTTRAAMTKLTDRLRKRFDMQIDRLDKFMALSMTRIETIRVRNSPPGFICHETSLLCAN